MLGKFYPNRIIPYNVAEAIVDPFYDDDDSVLARYTQQFSEGYRPFKQAWRHIEFSGICAQPGAVGTVSRDCAIDVTHYDHFNLRMTATDNLRVEVFLTVDGQRSRVLSAEGCGEFREAEGAFSGSTVQRIELVLTALRPGNLVCVIEWTGVFSAERLPLLELERPQYDSKWEGYLKPDSEIDPDTLAPLYDTFFGTEDIEKIRRKAALPEYATVMQSLRERARGFIGSEPEKEIRKTPHYLDAFTRDRYYYNGDLDWHIGAFSCTFLGLLDKDLSLLRMGMRIALSIAHCERFCTWSDSLPDTTWENRGFCDFINGNAVSLALNFGGSLLTEQGVHAIAVALNKKVVPFINQALVRHEYMWHSNQGIWVVSGWIITACTLTHVFPHADMLLDRLYEILCTISDAYIDEDGGSFEGANYLLYSLAMMLTALTCYARVRGLSPAAIASERLKKTPDYLATLLSEGYPSVLTPIADGGVLTSIRSIDSLCLLYHIFGDRAMLPIIREALRNPYRDVSMSFSNPAALMFGPDAFDDAPFVSPEFRILPAAGMLSSSRPTPDGCVRVFFNGCGPVDAGHSHSDRGELLLEAFGESLLYETGMIAYTNADHILLKKARYHNITAVGTLDELTEQRVPAESACIPAGEGDAVRLHARLDTAPAWGDAVIACTRELVSDTPTRLTVIDELEVPEARPVTQLWNSVGSFARLDDRTFTLTKNGVRATLTLGFDAKAVMTDNMRNELGENSHVLALECAPAVKHRLVTEITLEKLNG